MKSCIIFACTIISNDRLAVLHEFLESFKKNFADCDIFIGINSVSLMEVESIITSYKLNVISMKRCSDLLYSQSDASAYQEAILGLVNSKQTYDNYWFIHTKGSVNNHSDYLRSWYINNFFDKRDSVETFINTNDGIGSYGILGAEFNKHHHYNQFDTDIDIFKNTLTNTLPYTHSNFFYIHSIYVINKKPMEIFLQLISDTWFTSKLDRYYFEGIFPFIVARSGYFPYLENRISMNGQDLNDYQITWLTDNNLQTKYNHLINQFKTNYNFNQLEPPYVNSNT